ncbi:MAG: accessory gene regulator B family protein [Bacillota bacterium]|nr:accessory gene regulator B family protein [Bacillota bacterium]
MIQENIILRDDAEIYRYGTEQILINFMTFVVIGILATITGTWIETIFFFAGLIPIRMVAGGYHAKTPRRCNVLTFSVYMANMILIHLVGNHMMYLLSYTGCAVILTIILLFAPVDHKNRVLDGDEITKARRASRIIGAVIMGFCMVISALFRSENIFSTSTMMWALTASVSLFIGSLARGDEKYEEAEISK